MTNQSAHTASATNQSASIALSSTIGSLTFNQIGNKTFDEIGGYTFDSLYPPIANQTAHTASPTNQTLHNA
jgi:hypothetical protein